MDEQLRSRALLRYSLAAAIVVVIAGLFVWKEILSDGEASVLTDDNRAAIGEQAPDFVLSMLGGDQVRLSDYRGKTVVLNFWASWCRPCRSEMPEFQSLWEQRGGDMGDLVILAVDHRSDDSVSAVENFVEEFGLTFPVAFDTTDGDVSDRYGIRGLPATFFIDRDGVMRAMNLGPVFGDLLPDGVAAADTGDGA